MPSAGGNGEGEEGGECRGGHLWKQIIKMQLSRHLLTKTNHLIYCAHSIPHSTPSCSRSVSSDNFSGLTFSRGDHCLIESVSCSFNLGRKIQGYISYFEWLVCSGHDVHYGAAVSAV